MSESFITDPEDVFGLGDVMLSLFNRWSGEWHCTPWTNKPARVVVGYRCHHRRGLFEDRYVYLMPYEPGGIVVLFGPHGDPTRDQIVNHIDLTDEA